MQDENTGNAPDESTGTGESTPDPLKNLKSEVNRKIDQINQTVLQSNQAIEERLNALLNQLPKSAPATTPTTNRKDLLYDDPEEYARVVTEEATRTASEAASKIVNQTVQSQNEFNTTVAQLQSEYPEFQSNSSELTKKTLEIYKNLSAEMKNSSTGIRLAAREAAAELGIVPVNKRVSRNSEDFGLGSSSGSSRTRERSTKDVKLDPAAVEFARLLGRPVDDPKYIESLKKASTRKNYGKYE
jgi:uncharacterized phage infection (PIP) family protein YhgE